MIVPSIDVQDGLARGEDPLALARWYAAEGADELHLVDLDAAATGVPRNRELLTRIARSVDVPCRLAGGLADPGDARSALAAGVTGVLFSSAVFGDDALLPPIAALGAQAIVEIEARAGFLEPRGSGPLAEGAHGRGALAAARAATAAGVGALYAIDLTTEGSAAGPALALLAALREVVGPRVALHTGGGIGTLEHVRALAAAGAASAVIGRAFVERRFTIAEAKAACV